MNKQYLQDAAESVAVCMPDHHGFIILAVPIGENERVSYISNLSREDAVKVLSEFAEHAKSDVWMTHAK